MGYTTEFVGSYKIEPPLNDTDRTFLINLASTRRMKRNLGPEFGVDGEFFVDGGGAYGQDHDESVVDYNTPPATQPGLWNHWVPIDDGTELEWDGGEKFYNYEEWLKYIVNWLSPKGYVVNGETEWQGEDSDDFGKLIVTNNVVSVKIGRKTFD